MSVNDYFSDETTNSYVFRRTVSSSALVDVANIVIFSVTEAFSDNRKNSKSRKTLLTSDSVNFVYQISEQVSDVNSADIWFSQTKSNLKTSVSNGTFTSLLQSYSIDLNGIAFKNANASVTPNVLDPVIITIPSSDIPNADDESYALAPAIISVIAILSVCAVCIFCYCYRKKLYNILLYFKTNLKKLNKDPKNEGIVIIYLLL